MPIYEYRCGSCGHYLDALQKVNDPPLKDCPECGETALKRLISAPSFRLKGSGWYETDFKSDKEKRRNLAEGAGGKSGDGDSKSGSGDSGKAAKKEDSGKKSGDSGGKTPAAGSKTSGSKGSGSEAA